MGCVISISAANEPAQPQPEDGAPECAVEVTAPEPAAVVPVGADSPADGLATAPVQVMAPEPAAAVPVEANFADDGPDAASVQVMAPEPAAAVPVGAASPADGSAAARVQVMARKQVAAAPVRATSADDGSAAVPVQVMARNPVVVIVVGATSAGDGPNAASVQVMEPEPAAAVPVEATSADDGPDAASAEVMEPEPEAAIPVEATSAEDGPDAAAVQDMEPEPEAAVPADDGPDAASSPVADPTVAMPDDINEERQHPDMVPAEPDMSEKKEHESRWISVFDPNEPFADPSEPEEVPVLDLEMAMEQVGDDKAFLMELIKDTLDESDKRIQELNEAMETNDATKCRMVAHTIKGAAVNVGLQSLGRRAKIIERFCDSVLEGNSQESLSEKASPYISLIKEEYTKIEQFKSERLA